MRFKQLAARTEETYLQWIRRFILFHRREGMTLGHWRSSPCQLEMGLAASQGHGGAGGAGISDGPGGEAQRQRGDPESGVERLAISVPGGAGRGDGVGGWIRAGTPVTAGAGGIEPTGGARAFEAIDRHTAIDWADVICDGDAVDGGDAAAGQGCGFCPGSGHRARRQGGQGS